jgi:hypothetical protein
MRLTYVGKIECHECGTGYGKSGPLCEYENDGDPSGDAVILCEECFEAKDGNGKQDYIMENEPKYVFTVIFRGEFVEVKANHPDEICGELCPEEPEDWQFVSVRER